MHIVQKVLKALLDWLMGVKKKDTDDFFGGIDAADIDPTAKEESLVSYRNFIP